MLLNVGFSLELPLTDPVAVFALVMIIFLAAPRIAVRYRMPGLAGLLLAGILVGPHALGLLDRGPVIELLSTVGLIYLMFLAGAELDMQGFRRTRARSAVFGILTFTIPFALSFAAARGFGLRTNSAVLLGAIFATQTLVAYPIAIRLGIQKSEAATIAVGGTILTDVAVLLVLAVVANAQGGSLDLAFWLRLMIPLTLVVVAVLFGFPWLARAFLRREGSEGAGPYVFMLTMIFAAAVLAELAGVEAIIGAFLAGLALNPLIPAGGTLASRVQFVGEAIFIPFFLVGTGMLVDVRIFASDFATWRVMGVLLAIAIGSKWLAAFAAARLFGYSRAQAWTLYGLSVSHAAATIAVALVGLNLGLFDESVLNVVILIILVSCLIGPMVVERYGRELALEEGQKPHETSGDAERMLVPLSNPKTAPGLVDLALLARPKGSGEPLYALTVVPEAGGSTDEFVANAEKMLNHAVAYAAAAEVRVLPLTRVDQNFASGIVRGMVETRTTTLFVGWDGRGSREWMFGSVLDQVLEQTAQQVVVAMLGHPLNTTRRVTLVVPKGADHMRGFFDSVALIKLIANRLNTPITVLVVESDPEIYRRQIDAVAPADVPLTFEGVADWSRALPWLRDNTRPEDLVVALAARRGTVAWHPGLLRLPSRLARLASESFLMVYPGARGDGAREPLGKRGLARSLTADRIVVPLESLTYDDGVDDLLRRQFGANTRRVKELGQVLRAQGPPLCIAPGVAISHARVDSLSEPMVFLGVSPNGLSVPAAETPVHVVMLVLSPDDQPTAHLEVLADIARAMATGGRVARLRGATDSLSAQEALLT